MVAWQQVIPSAPGHISSRTAALYSPYPSKLTAKYPEANLFEQRANDVLYDLCRLSRYQSHCVGMSPANGVYMPAGCILPVFLLFHAQLWDTARAHLHAGMSSRPRSNTTTPGRPVDRATEKNDSSTCICIKMMLCSNASSCDAMSGARPAHCTTTTVCYNLQGILAQS